MCDHRMTWFFVEKWGKVSRAILRRMFPKKISQTRGLSSRFQTVLHRVSKSWKASHGPWWGQGRVVRGEPVRGFSPLLRLLTSTVLLLHILCIKNMLSIFRFLCNIALYSIGPCFYHQSHTQLGIVFALDPSLHSFWSYFSTDLQEHIGHLPTWGVPLSVSYHFAFSYCSWGSQGKNTEVVCHSLFQWTTFCQISPPWPAHLGLPHRHGLVSLS